MKAKTKTAIVIGWALAVELCTYALYGASAVEAWRNDYSHATYTLLLAISSWIITADRRRLAFKRWKEGWRCSQ